MWAEAFLCLLGAMGMDEHGMEDIWFEVNFAKDGGFGLTFI